MSGPILVTGAAGFIGFHLATHLLAAGREVVGVDSLTDCYDGALKRDRLALLTGRPGFVAEPLDLADAAAVRSLFGRHSPSRVVHMAARPGVRRSIEAPEATVQANVVAFLNILEGCRHGEIAHFVFASSSSVYGGGRPPFSVADDTDHPVSLYAATKKADEAMAHSYSHLFGLPTTGLRFFTVYGPWGRPDMAVWIFTDAIRNGRPIDVADGGRVLRDFTYVDDVVAATASLLERPPSPGPDGAAPYRLWNVGNDAPETLDRLVGLIEREASRPAIRRDIPLPPGDVPETRADISDLRREIGFAPTTPLAEGIRRFVAWHRERYP